VTLSQSELPFETAFSQLEEVVQQLEGGDLLLEEALALYERGIALAGHCQALLDQAELRVTQMVGEGEEEPFEEGQD
jgi:exodeoxyribonuclease VII small subunit